MLFFVLLKGVFALVLASVAVVLFIGAMDRRSLFIRKHTRAKQLMKTNLPKDRSGLLLAASVLVTIAFFCLLSFK